jgi:hypothetical protein
MKKDKLKIKKKIAKRTEKLTILVIFTKKGDIQHSFLQYRSEIVCPKFANIRNFIRNSQNLRITANGC